MPLLSFVLMLLDALPLLLQALPMTSPCLFVMSVLQLVLGFCTHWWAI
jgi:hypothetical protein